MPLFFAILPVMVYFILLILGLAFGSFINALVWRMHTNKTYRNKQQKGDKLSVWRGRSMCTHCKKTLEVKDLVPVLSWLTLRGKCRYCTKKIEDTPLAEILLPLLLIASYAFWPHGFAAIGLALFVVWAGLLVIMTALLVYDLRWMLLPDRLTYSFIGWALISVGLRAGVEGLTVLPQALFGLVSVGGLFYVLHRVSNGKWIGGGDVKLGFGIGLLVGSPVLGFMTIFFASILGSLSVLPQLLQRKKGLTSKIPFGPFLILATIIVFLFGEQIFAWYNAFFFTL